MWVPRMQDPIRHMWKCCSEVLGLQLVSHQELQVDPNDKITHMFSGGSVSKESACNAGDLGLIPGLGRAPGEGNPTHSSILTWRIPWTEEPGGI